MQRSARHILWRPSLKGYANGWLVSGSGSATLKLRYAPDRWTTAARFVSGCGLGIVAVGALVLAVAEVRNRRKRPPIN